MLQVPEVEQPAQQVIPAHKARRVQMVLTEQQALKALPELMALQGLKAYKV